jgi:Protein of unknown function (DUF2442)
MKTRRRNAETSSDPFSAHEALDRSHLLASVFSDFVAEHSFIAANPKLRREAEDLAERLGALYRAIGQVVFADIDQREPLAVGLRFEKGRLIVELDDQREVSIPLSRFPTLAKARPAQRADWELIGPGKAFYWKALDLDLSVRGLVGGLPEVIPAPPLRRAKRSA